MPKVAIRENAGLETRDHDASWDYGAQMQPKGRRLDSTGIKLFFPVSMKSAQDTCFNGRLEYGQDMSRIEQDLFSCGRRLEWVSVLTLHPITTFLRERMQEGWLNDSGRIVKTQSSNTSSHAHPSPRPFQFLPPPSYLCLMSPASQPLITS
ncbi:hypothetical protein CPC08DRAFT_443315 [Agrocybe pediades]|nr:hypothetical protein CPC08DRAFT_443315 [Agrocybe pediades]